MEPRPAFRKADSCVPGVLKASSGFIAASGSPECTPYPPPPGFPFCPLVRFLKQPSKGESVFFFFFGCNWTGWGYLSAFSGEKPYFIDLESPHFLAYLLRPVLHRAILGLQLHEFNMQVCLGLSVPSCRDRCAHFVTVGCFAVSYREDEEKKVVTRVTKAFSPLPGPHLP